MTSLRRSSGVAPPSRRRPLRAFRETPRPAAPHRRGILLMAAVASVVSCRGRQSALDPAGLYAEEIAELWWIYLAVTVLVWVLVVGFMLVAVLRRKRQSSERRLMIGVGAAAAVTVATLFGLLIASNITGNELLHSRGTPVMTVEITSEQWWWDVVYDDGNPLHRFTTANEIYLPVGKPVTLVLESRDVIHSIWIPNLHGKRDLIPGRENRFVIQADRPGEYEGQCAEFCGLQHAKMRLAVTAVSEAEFDAWLSRQRRPAASPRTPAETKGREVFLARTCATCHTVMGTPAQGKTGPDLTHLASRRGIAANSLPNTAAHLSTWIVNPQRWKPGNNMPPSPLPPDELAALVTWLRSLR